MVRLIAVVIALITLRRNNLDKKAYNITYSIGGLGYVQLTVYTELSKDDSDFYTTVDKLAVEQIIKEVNDYGDISSFD